LAMRVMIAVCVRREPLTLHAISQVAQRAVDIAWV
jgi:hypothetical protein